MNICLTRGSLTLVYQDGSGLPLLAALSLEMEARTSRVQSQHQLHSRLIQPEIHKVSQTTRNQANIVAHT